MKITKLSKGNYQTTLPNGMEVDITDRRVWDEEFDNHPTPWAVYFDNDADEFKTKREAVAYLHWLVENNERYQAA
jgi:hypothetical protein